MDFVVQADAIHIGVVTFCLLAGTAPGSDRLCTGVRRRRNDCSNQYGGHLMRNVGWSRYGTHRSVSSRGSYRLDGSLGAALIRLLFDRATNRRYRNRQGLTGRCVFVVGRKVDLTSIPAALSLEWKANLTCRPSET